MPLPTGWTVVQATTASWAGQAPMYLVGGPGNDAAYYASSAAAVTVNLLDGTGTGGDAEGDTLDSIENISGSAFDDTLTGNAGNNVLSGRAGADLLDGGEGTDTVSYSGSNAGVTVNLLTGAGERGHAQGDLLSNIENLIGSRYNDDLTGDTGNNVLRAGAGDDVPHRRGRRRTASRVVQGRTRSPTLIQARRPSPYACTPWPPRVAMPTGDTFPVTWWMSTYTDLPTALRRLELPARCGKPHRLEP